MKWLIDIFKRMFGWLGRTGSRTLQEAASFAVGQATSAALEPPMRELVYAANAKWPTEKPGVPDFIEGYFRGIVPESDLRRHLRELGFNDWAINVMVESRKQLLDVGRIQELYNRGEITAEEAKRRFAQLGYDEKQQEELLKLAGYIPTVSDFIRMAVREVFTPAIAEKYGLFEDYPEELDKYAKMAGLDPQFAKYYWAAHWELPSYTEGVEMYHRGIITYDELVTLSRPLR